MISDVLHEAISNIDDYLNSQAFDKVYTGDLRERIIKLRDDMVAMRTELDTPPSVPVVQKPLKTEPSRTVGLSITVLDEKPTTVILGLTDGWGQPFNLCKADEALLTEVREKHFRLYEGEMMVNATLTSMARAIDVFMRERYPQRYTGHVKVRRGRKVGDEYRYTYIGYE